MYKTRGFTATAIYGDDEFDIKAINEFLPLALLHIYGKNEHVALIERSTRTRKTNVEQ